MVEKYRVFLYLCLPMWQFFKNIIQLIIQPDNGWVDISETRRERPLWSMQWCFAIVALTSWVQLFYHARVSVVTVIQLMVMVYVSLWVAYFIGSYALSLFIPRVNDGVLDEERLNSFMACGMSLLSLQVMLGNLLPINYAILELWPLYVVVIMWRGKRYLEVPERKTGVFLAVVILSMVLPFEGLLKMFYSVIA